MRDHKAEAQDSRGPTGDQARLPQIRKDMSGMIEGHRLLAKLLRAKYMALINEGFSKEQAFELGKKVEY